MTQTRTMPTGQPVQPGMPTQTTTTTMRNCSVQMACTEQYKNMSCSGLPPAKCDIKCCSKELCNTDTSPVLPTTTSSNMSTKAPSG